MKTRKLQDAIGLVGDDLVSAARDAKAKPKHRIAIVATAAVLALAIALGAILMPVNEYNNSPVLRRNAIALANYPQMAQYPAGIGLILSELMENSPYDLWREDCLALKSAYKTYGVDISGFVEKTIPEFLSNSGDENIVYSPLNVYMALAMLAEMTDANSREQILVLLGESDIEALRVHANAVWQASYCDDGAVTSIPAGSVWLNDDVEYNKDTFSILAKNYYASSFSGNMGSKGYSEAYREWLNKQTGGLIKKQVADSAFDEQMILTLATTLHFCAKWDDEFSESRTAPAVFHSASGDIICDYMNSSGSDTYFWAEKFGAVRKGFNGNTGAMWFILPDEGVGVEKIINDAQLAEFITANGDWENSKQMIVNLSVPKFDISSEIDLSDGLKSLGVTDVFDINKSNFTPTTTESALVLSRASHGARVQIDEEGCTAAAYTELPLAGAAEPPDEIIDFVLDRPFIFVITSSVGLPLFVGVVNDPAQN